MVRAKVKAKVKVPLFKLTIGREEKKAVVVDHPTCLGETDMVSYG